MNVQLIQKTASLLGQLQEVLTQLNDEQYTEKVKLLSGATIGQHTRHIIEFFLELDSGYASGIVNYDARNRDREIETKRRKAIDKIAYLDSRLRKEDRQLTLHCMDGSRDDITPLPISSTYTRELLYNLEHTTHHMALMRIAVQLLSTIELPENFGVAHATIKYRNSCAQ